MSIFDFFITCIIPLLIVNYIAKKPQEEFIKMYQKKVNKDDLFLPNEYIQKYRKDSANQLKDAPKQFSAIFRLLFASFKDKELNRAASKVKLYFILQVVIIILNFVLIVYSIRTS